MNVGLSGIGTDRFLRDCLRVGLLLRQHPRLRIEHFTSYASELNPDEGGCGFVLPDMKRISFLLGGVQMSPAGDGTLAISRGR